MWRYRWAAVLGCVLLAGMAYGYQRELVEAVPTIGITAPFSPQYVINEEPQSSLDNIAGLCGLTGFARRYDTDGAGQKIAIIDSGVDLGHRAFGSNSDGTAKVARYRDYTQAGQVLLEPVTVQNGMAGYRGRRYRLDQLAGPECDCHMGLLSLEQLRPQLFSGTDRQLAVLVVGQQLVYVDTDGDGQFADETALRHYDLQQQTLPLDCGPYALTVALTSLEVEQGWLQLSTDVMGHGTFLAGLLAANGERYQGLAPQAQLYVYQIFDSKGSTSQLLLARALHQAVEDGVQLINLSLSISREEAVSDALQQALAQAEQAGIPIIGAVGNYGPGKGSVAYPAREETVIGVGSYVDPSMWELDHSVLLLQPFVADYSGRGQLDGTCSPTLVAPAGVISTVPGWYGSGYLYDYGTSISAAVVTGALAHVTQQLEREHRPLTAARLRAMLPEWTETLGLPQAEQGAGRLRLTGLSGEDGERAASRQPAPQPVVYQDQPGQSWPFSIGQGQSQSWYIQVAPDRQQLEVLLRLTAQPPTNPQEHLVAMGRCRLRIYNPQGELVQDTAYFGATYQGSCITERSATVSRPQPGCWELTVTSDPWLSRYNHLRSEGSLVVQAR